jgi:hypothetical protein
VEFWGKRQTYLNNLENLKNLICGIMGKILYFFDIKAVNAKNIYKCLSNFIDFPDYSGKFVVFPKIPHIQLQIEKHFIHPFS